MLKFPDELEINRPYPYTREFLSPGQADDYLQRINAEVVPQMGPADTYGRMKGGELDCSTAFSGYRKSVWIGGSEITS